MGSSPPSGKGDPTDRCASHDAEHRGGQLPVVNRILVDLAGATPDQVDFGALPAWFVRDCARYWLDAHETGEGHDSTR